MARKFLNPDNALMITMTQITDCIFLSLFFLIGCIPVFTVGASFAMFPAKNHKNAVADCLLCFSFCRYAWL